MQEDWTRYSCQLKLPGFGKDMQRRLQQAKVLIVGAGGLGCPAAQYLAASGIGTLGIADFDVVSMDNLHRQILYTPGDLGTLKAETACRKLREQNPQVRLIPILDRITRENVLETIEGYDIVVDGTDNFYAKYVLNDACVMQAKPLVYGAIYQFEGQVAVLNFPNADGTFSPHYRDLFPHVRAAQIPSCAEGGVIPPIAGIIGSMQANEVIKCITGIGAVLSGKILIIDARNLHTRIIQWGADSKMPVTELPKMDEIRLINALELRNALDKHLVELVDVRSLEERNTYHIGGKHIPIGELEGNVSIIDSDKALVFYCESGKRSAEAVRIVQNELPSATLYSLDGGLKAWTAMKWTLNDAI
jgi:sulfur-carrier protein adenylyltransferase/sulfurtransferase